MQGFFDFMKSLAGAARRRRRLKEASARSRWREWERMYAEAASFQAEHAHLDATDKGQDGELIGWLDRQRHLHAEGMLDAARTCELDRLGMIWNKHDNAWERGFAHARAFAARTGHLAIPAQHKLDGHSTGAWMGRQRKADNLTKSQQRALDGLDPLWRLEPDWNRSYRRMTAYLRAGGTLTGPANRTGGPSDPRFRPGPWLRKQVRHGAAGQLTEQQITLLEALTTRYVT